MAQYDIWTTVPYDFLSTGKKGHDNAIESDPFKGDRPINETTINNGPLCPPKTPPKQPLETPEFDDVPLSVLLNKLEVKEPSPVSSKAPLQHTELHTARYLRIGNLPSALQPKELAIYFQARSDLGATRGVLTDHLPTYGFVILAFHDARDAKTAAEQLRYERGFGTALETECITREELLQITSMSQGLLSESEGEVQIDVLALSPSATPSAQLIQAVLTTSLPSNVVRDVAAFSIEQADHTALRARCTFFDDRLALSAVSATDSHKDPKGCRFIVSLHTLPTAHLRPSQNALVAQDLSGFINPFTMLPVKDSPTFPKPSRRAKGTTAAPAQGRHAVPNDNVVDLEAIELGLDSRTTIMLKNLPNRMTDARLFQILNGVTPRAFDFLYVRIDFDTCSSVGYAFVNFLTPQDVLRFGRARLGTRWDPATSEKQVYMSYANIQGKGACINKFRNSGVMNERVSFRPKVFHSSGPNVGLPAEFPAPDTAVLPRRAPMARYSSTLQPYDIGFLSDLQSFR